jgi:hypothetical protein
MVEEALGLFLNNPAPPLLHEEEAYMGNTASWAWQQLSVGKKATVDCHAEVYVENLSLLPVWFDPSWNRIWK